MCQTIEERRRAYEERLRQAKIEQMDKLAGYLEQNLKLNAHIREKAIHIEPDQKTLERISAIPIQPQGRDVEEVANELIHDVFEKAMLIQHPRFFSFVASAVSPFSLTGAVLTDIYNPHGGAWMEAPGACLIEEKLIKWMASLAGFPENTSGGLFVSGGSMANITALHAARVSHLTEDEYAQGVAYLSDQTHSSVAKGLRILGLRKDQIVKIPVDDSFRMRTDLLNEAIIRDIEAGKKPYVVIGTIGTTNTGTIDPLQEIADIADKYGLWFHVDGAYGASILISDIYRNLAKGIERADSLSWDTHKWMLQSYSCSSVIVRNRKHLFNAFVEHPEYLADISSQEHVDPWDLGMEMSRPHRALKLWVTVQAMGTDAMADVVDYAFFMAKIAEREITALPNWEITSKPMCGTLTFRYAPDGYTEEQLDDINSRISQLIIKTGYAFIVTTVLKGRKVLRLCLINGNTVDSDVVETIARLDECAKEVMTDWNQNPN